MILYYVRCNHGSSCFFKGALSELLARGPQLRTLLQRSFSSRKELTINFCQSWLIVVWPHNYRIYLSNCANSCFRKPRFVFIGCLSKETPNKSNSHRSISLPTLKREMIIRAKWMRRNTEIEQSPNVRQMLFEYLLISSRLIRPLKSPIKIPNKFLKSSVNIVTSQYKHNGLSIIHNSINST